MYDNCWNGLFSIRGYIMGVYKMYIKKARKEKKRRPNAAAYDIRQT